MFINILQTVILNIVKHLCLIRKWNEINKYYNLLVKLENSLRLLYYKYLKVANRIDCFKKKKN